mgnify:CR=1 FL=1
MKFKRFAMVLVLLVSASILATAQASGAPPRGARNYNPSTETTVKGTVEEVTQQTGTRGWGGTHLLLKTDSENFDVHVGPSQYVSRQGFAFAKGDQIEVTGSKVTLAGKEALIARQIKKGDKVLALRDEQGIPKWSRGGRGR